MYVKETHPNKNLPQPSTFEERIELYEEYKGKYNITIPALIDRMDNRWKELYDPGPTSCTLVDIRGIVVYTVQFIMFSGYSTIEKEINKLLKVTEEQLTSINYNQQGNTTALFSIERVSPDCFSIIISSEGRHEVDIFNMQGMNIFSRKGYGSTEFPFNTPVSTGKYLFKITAGNETVIKPVIISK